MTSGPIQMIVQPAYSQSPIIPGGSADIFLYTDNSYPPAALVPPNGVDLYADADAAPASREAITIINTGEIPKATKPLPAPLFLIHPKQIGRLDGAFREKNQRFLENRKRHVLVIVLDCMECRSAGERLKEIIHVKTGIKRLNEADIKVTFLRQGDVDSIGFGSDETMLREIVFRNPRAHEKGRERLMIPELALALAQTTIFEAGLTGVKPENYYRFVNAVGTDSAVVGQMQTQFWKFLVSLEKLKKHFEPILPSAVTIDILDLYAVFSPEGTGILGKLGDLVVEAWKKSQNGKEAPSVPIHDWISERLGLSSEEKNKLSSYRYAWINPKYQESRYLGFGRILFDIIVGGRLPEFEYNMKRLNRLLYTPSNADRKVVDEASNNVSWVKKWRILLKGLLGAPVWYKLNDDNTLAAMALGLSARGRLPHLEPAAALVAGDVQTLEWARKLQVSPSVGYITADILTETRLFLDQAGAIFQGGAKVYADGNKDNTKAKAKKVKGR